MGRRGMVRVDVDKEEIKEEQIRGRKEQERKMDKVEYRAPVMSESTHRLLIMQKNKNCSKGVQTLL